MKTLFTLWAMCLTLFAGAANYYFSSSTGDDSRTAQQAQDPGTPWRTLGKLNAVLGTLAPGDVVHFKRGNVFYGAIIANRSGTATSPILFTAYGTGSQPVISGFTTLSGMTGAGGGIWEATLPQAPARVNLLLYNGKVMPMGRFPNAGAANQGYLTLEAYQANTQITDQQLSGTPVWTGGEVVIRKNRSTIDRNLISLHAGNTISYVSESPYYATTHYGYFIQNHPQTLDGAGEWYFNSSARKLGIHLGSSTPAENTVRATTIDNLVHITGHYLSFRDLHLEGANQYAFEVRSVRGIRISNCTITYTGVNAVNASSDLFDFTLENTSISYTNNVGCLVNNGINTVIRNNRIRNTGTFAGMGRGNIGSYEAVMVNGSQTVIEGNEIRNTGYIGITFSGSDVLIKNNLVDSFCLLKDDGSGIYTWNGMSNPPVNARRELSGNIVLNGLGAMEGTEDLNQGYAYGIYLDDNADMVKLANNTVAHCATAGIFLHNAHAIGVENNTLFNNRRQLLLQHDHIAPNSPLRAIDVRNNILVSKTAAQLVADHYTIKNDIADFGTFNNNFYCRPVDDNLVIKTVYVANGTWYSKMIGLDAWKAAYGKDLASKKSPVQLPAYTIQHLATANKFRNGDFSTNIAGLYTYAPAGNCTNAWTGNSPLDGGALKIAFTHLTGSANRSSVIMGIGPVVANKAYILRFSLRGTNENKSLGVFLRKSGANYNDLSERKFGLISEHRTEQEFLLVPSVSEADASLVLDVEEQAGPLYIDNIQLREANVAPVNPDDHIQFEYNATAAPRTVQLDGYYVDAKDNAYAGTVTLAPYSSVVLFAKAMFVLPVRFAALTAACSSGRTRLSWQTLSGSNTVHMDVQKSTEGTHWETAGSVPPAPAGEGNGQYTFTDPANAPLYRIAAIDREGKTTYSSIVRPGCGKRRESISVFPNPAKGPVDISLQAAQASVLQGYLYGPDGTLLRTFEKTVVPGSNRFRLDLTGLAQGIYTLSLYGNGAWMHKKLLKVK